MYAPDPVEPGSSVSHYDTAVTPNALMEPFITGPTSDLDLTVPLLTDLGWGTGGYRLSLPIPGFVSQTNTVTARGATPGEVTFLIYDFTAGSVNVPGCPGVTARIQDVNILTNGPADADGEFAFPFFAPPVLSGLTLLMQAVELSTCISNLTDYTWP